MIRSNHLLVVLLRYYKMDVTKSLRENLSHKTVIEYPTLHVCMTTHSSDYVIYDPSVDDGMINKTPEFKSQCKYLSAKDNPTIGVVSYEGVSVTTGGSSLQTYE